MSGMGAACREGLLHQREAPVTRLVLMNGAGFGYVGIEGFDDIAIVLFDDAAFEFQRKGEAAIVESEVFWKQGEALDGFILSEMNGEALHFGVD